MRTHAPCLSPVGTAVLLIAPVVFASLFYVWTQVTTVRLGYAISKAGEIHQSLLEENRGLRIQIASLRAPDRLKGLAEKQYRLEPPRPEQVVHLGLGDRASSCPSPSSSPSSSSSSSREPRGASR